jgi:hypothetical protein
MTQVELFLNECIFDSQVEPTLANPRAKESLSPLTDLLPAAEKGARSRSASVHRLFTEIQTVTWAPFLTDKECGDERNSTIWGDPRNIT